jgi:uncharacterized glyoxalase superfamily protein PhnB
LRRRCCRFRVGVEGRDEGRARARPQLRVLVQQQAVAALGLAHQGRVVLRLAGPPLQGEQADVAAKGAHRGWDMASSEDLESYRNLTKADFVQSLERLDARTETVAEMVQFSKDFDFDSRDLYVFHELDKIGRFDLASVGAAVKRALDPDRARVAVFKPSKEGAKGDRRSRVRFQTRSHDAVEAPEVDPAEARRPIRLGTELKLLATATRLTLGNGMIMLGSARDDEFGKLMKTPAQVGGASTQGSYIIVPDADAHHARAVAAGAKVVYPLKDEDYGGRGYSCLDPEGNVWSFGTYDPWK